MTAQIDFATILSRQRCWGPASAMGGSPPEFRTMKDAAMDAQLTGEFSTVQEAEEWVRGRCQTAA